MINGINIFTVDKTSGAIKDEILERKLALLKAFVISVRKTYEDIIAAPPALNRIRLNSIVQLLKLHFLHLSKHFHSATLCLIT